MTDNLDSDKILSWCQIGIITGLTNSFLFWQRFCTGHIREIFNPLHTPQFSSKGNCHGVGKIKLDMKPQSSLWMTIPGIVSTCIALGILINPLAGKLYSQCPLTCLGQTNLSLGPDGTALFTVENGLANIQANCLPDYTVMLTDDWDQPIANPVDCSQLGKNLTFKVTYGPSGNHCWGNVFIEDKLAPSITCTGDTIHCNASPDPAFAGTISVSDNCDPEPDIHLAFEEVRELPCDHPSFHIREIERRWFATDTSGNQSPTCTQIIRIRRATLGDIQFPPNKTGNSAISCDTPNIDPTITGMPTVFGSSNDPLCKVVFTYTDDTLATCAGGFHVDREWTAVDCCTNEMTAFIQLIDVVDTIAPILICPADMTISTKEDTCTADFTLPLATGTDNCSPGFSLTVSTSWGGVGTGPYVDLPEGGYKVHYTAIDSCGNSSTCTMDFVIKDKVPPVALCHFPVNAFLNNVGLDTIRIPDVDAGSYDNCSMTMWQIKLMGEHDSLFRDSILVDCSFIGKDTMVILRVTDCWNNTAFCMTSLVAVDTLPPNLNCPGDMALECVEYMLYPDIGGTATAMDNCTGHTLNFTDSLNVNDCGVGTINRIWTAMDTYGNIVTCSQIISLIDATLPQVFWPADITVNCSQPLEAPFPGEPQVFDNCSLLAVGYRDSLIMVPGCDTLYRIWRVKDWCTSFDTSYIQKINLTDPVPVLDIDCPDDVTVYLNAACEVYIPLDTVVAFDECGHFLFVTNDSPYADAAGANASGTYPIGEHVVTFMISDACSDVSCSLVLSIRDTIPPLITCEGITPCINADSTYLLDPLDMVTNLFDLCSDITVVANETQFNCNDIMQLIPITLTAQDASGNMSTCTDTLFILNCDVCQNGIQAGAVQLKGRVMRWDGIALAHVPVEFDFGPYQEWTLTDNEGYYSSDVFPQGVDLRVRAHPIPGDLDGLTTADIIALSGHLIGDQPLEFLESWLAADINQSGTISIGDLVALRKSILLQISNLKAGFWRMMPSDMVLEGLEALSKEGFWDGSYRLDDITGLIHSLNFTGVKSGDINRSTMLQTDNQASFRYLDINDMSNTVQAGQNLRIVFTAPHQDLLTGLQLCLGYDYERLRFEGVESLELENMGPEHLASLEHGLIRISWDNVLIPADPAGKALFALNFLALQNMEVKDLLWLQTNGFPAEYYYTRDERARIILRWPEAQKQEDPGEFVLYPAQPNPFSNQTWIPFDLPTEGAVKLTLIHPNGVIVHEMDEYLPAGHHRLLLDGAHLPGPGLYHYQLRTASGISIRQLSYTP